MRAGVVFELGITDVPREQPERMNSFSRRARLLGFTRLREVDRAKYHQTKQQQQDQFHPHVR